MIIAHRVFVYNDFACQGHVVKKRKRTKNIDNSLIMDLSKKKSRYVINYHYVV